MYHTQLLPSSVFTKKCSFKTKISKDGQTIDGILMLTSAIILISLLLSVNRSYTSPFHAYFLSDCF